MGGVRGRQHRPGEEGGVPEGPEVKEGVFAQDIIEMLQPCVYVYDICICICRYMNF